MRDGKLDVEYLRFLGEPEFNWADKLAGVTPAETEPCQGAVLAWFVRRHCDYFKALKLPLEWQGAENSLMASRRAYTLIPRECDYPRTNQLTLRDRSQSIESLENFENQDAA